ncbi:MAG: hypothetical protein FWE11_08125 [Defluviitaleaceae bacterium]|nr:hypothetical protein [Defluviitaleaceae bacterium]
MEQNFGNELQREAFTSGQVFGKRIKYYLVVLLAVGFGALMLAGEDALTVYREETIMLVVISAVVAVFFILLAHVLVKGGELVIYEGGFSYTRGGNTISVPFSQVASTYRESDTVGGGFLVGGLIGMLPIFQVHKFILVKNNGAKQTALRHRRTPGYKFMTRELDMAFTRYLLKDLSINTLASTNISFGDQLQLRNGGLVLTTRKWRKTNETIIPFESIYSMSESEPILLEGHPNEKGKKETLVNLGVAGHNIEVLRQIIKMVQQG